jgi:hypothetical protein
MPEVEQAPVPGPKDPKRLDDYDSKSQSEPEGPPIPPPPPPSPSDERPQTNSVGQYPYAARFASQKYHPVVLIGSAAAGKTVLILSLLAYLKENLDEKRLSIYFGDDLLRPENRDLQASAKRYFDLTVAQYMRGTADQATRIDAPMFIPVKVCGESRSDGEPRPELKFALMEGDGEWFQPNWDPSKGAFIPPFKPVLESLLRQYSDGISFLWVAPRTARPTSGAASNFDVEELTRRSDESLQGAFGNYEALRRHNSARDLHMLLVSQWDTHFSDTSPGDVRQNLDRNNDPWIKHEVEEILKTNYKQTYAAFRALSSPPGNKVVFRYSAGLFDSREKSVGDLRDILLTYPRDIWNWLYEGMRRGHEWELDSGPLLPKPAQRKKTVLQRWDDFVTKLLG